MDYTVIKALDNEELYLKVYECKNPKGCIQVIHGMMEHQDRYEAFANYYNKLGYTVVTSDLRGHGKNAKFLGRFAKKDGYIRLISDQLVITNYINNTLKISKVILFGHSMGSIIARDVLIDNSASYEKVILSGFPYYQSGAHFGIWLSGFVQTFKTSYGKSKMLDKLTCGRYSKKIKNRKTDFDWLSFNEENVKNYINDPLCGIEFTACAYGDLFKLLKLLHKKKSSNTINLPILLLNGKEDPVVRGKIGYKQTITDLNTQGFDNLTHVEFDNMRHEILNEKENILVYQEIDKFLGE